MNLTCNMIQSIVFLGMQVQVWGYDEAHVQLMEQTR